MKLLIHFLLEPERRVWKIANLSGFLAKFQAERPSERGSSRCFTPSGVKATTPTDLFATAIRGLTVAASVCEALPAIRGRRDRR
jgi:hypothetical protein